MPARSVPHPATPDARAAEHDGARSLEGERFEVVVGAVAHGGFCVARHEGRAVFVRHALPGERVVALVTEGTETDRFLRADAVEILEASPDRVEAPCPFSGPGTCGGCDWQHATLEAQRRLKAQVVQEQLHRLAKIDREVVVEELPGSPDGLGWRTRVQFAVDGLGRVGLRKHRSHEVVSVDHCAIAAPQVEQVGVEGRSWPGMAGIEVIAATGSSDRAVVVTPHAGRRVPLVEADVPVSVLRGDGKGGTQRIHGRGHVREVAAGHTWRVSGSGFWQVHPAAADTLNAAVLEAVRPQPGETAMDLYCGAGLFAAGLAEAVGPDGEVVAVESDAGALADAAANLSDYQQVVLVGVKVERAFEQAPPGFEAEVVVLDPPRSGAGRAVVGRIAAVRPRAVAYVACDPAALARDLAYFAQEGYELAGLRAFDLFPMTHHVECVASLVPAAR
ncbi:MAG TPA: class I SAM-dependent RNA methyltransferase [Actinocrinis sp.]|uniref:class I SAM-dependent RNA methyltransferase n=1 Tax=Actinocrinis sp. TaxID=1920516 RepID=UPI002DDC931E|nr:class I SAM-dependent RNA methyltransferase [Actinocrinis sp.]HEV3169909.1 class I SAM-dependent RNA methyltransferase [Actinocrinis sp.]